MKADLNKLAKFLKEKRTQANLSQKDVATKLGYSTSQFISNWERGISQPPIHTLRTLAQMYAVSPDQMFQVLLSTTIDQVQEELKEKFYGTGDGEATTGSQVTLAAN
ncbi:MAG: transcriptional regulator [Bdellovibrionales bacterium RIFCSPHIGHO2_01_FULL_40_29]|nr:MAG: transcriptional regulator [Bdellovibrionales bacterium RIFCSPHIGHO2_01_FULL_40_29]OFZ35435.1 MAG: transcriptional regulator [Bdellovibrionales bacterium RIFCSPHIGHO2_02_FULL_40_15]